ncbi:MAG: DUF4124 domain-containing protein [Comamonadaceae bacterium]|nr:MAG: DUF4124 domain-containing protein [Comamonadaceae bacterium]
MTHSCFPGGTAAFLGLAATVLALLAPAAQAASICRWIDEDGRTQLSDTVPERYKSRASCTDAKEYDVTPVPRQAAPAGTGANASTGNPNIAGAAPRPRAKRPAEGVTDSTDCQTWWRRYEESEACFGPYRTARGGIKAEAFDACTAVPNPESKCSAQKN